MEPGGSVSFLFCHAEKNHGSFRFGSNYQLHMSVSSANVIIPAVSWRNAFVCFGKYIDTPQKEYEKYVHKKLGYIDGDNSLTWRKYCNIAEVFFKIGFFGLADEHSEYQYDDCYPVPLAAFFLNKAKNILFCDSVL